MLTIFSRLLRDAEYFRAQISRLDGSDDLGPHLVDLVEKKVIATAEAAEVVIPNGNGSNGDTRDSGANSPRPVGPATNGNAVTQTGAPSGNSDS